MQLLVTICLFMFDRAGYDKRNKECIYARPRL